MVAGINLMQETKSIRDVEIEGKRVLIRVDFNVPMDSDFNISDDTRIREAIPTINHCIDNGAKSIVLVSHLGRPRGKSSEFSLKHILKRLERLLNRSVIFVESLEGVSSVMATLPQKSVILLENIRFLEGEEKNDEKLSKNLASLCDIYINDAFGASHRKHASTYGVAKFAPVKVAGLLLKKEIDSFAKALASPLKPVLLIVGGSKVSSKITLLSNILDVVDKIVIGGAMSNTFLKSLGYDMQRSLVEDPLVPEAAKILGLAKQKGVKIYLPVDVVCTDDIKNPKEIKITPAQDVPENFLAADIGPASVKLFGEVIRDCETIIWNGPMGVYEVQNFSRGTFQLAHVVADTYAYSVIGGGDTADAIDRAGEKDNMSFTSTGGGASLELLEGKILPAFEVLERK
ncbi:phosphoglycerate kinase [Wolinella succinogenes]|uniref:Phosphoglycerate kinase n=1 Tax=Wolinella succinogenes (strain ATCC 29543 / DSM 1740 / CCUG 13145 / JCM 31913 / LMG 7466 / NCTC 11488 / FDC 602W) TaxID=273121 RepID=PGK_WOLSU|nr:phosphoglycerate kinase [Wolinella succinogenes]Q7M9C1.1 RecName: Full=Phosphoglycerate kinase [Wolinella succinogenes DSM 1740]CAE10131.1 PHOSPHOGLYCERATE KINASE [Wolinella succinogenes]VEG82339.1 Phosphoglycerate kinase [Wolinella succinogenes]HCZ18229.1 phosphoglycerate kinase [Helicobacter sp.]